jgi:SAM-dependent methyltransferase
MTFFDGGKVNEQFAKVKEQEKYKVYQLVLLAYLDAMGYARRVNKATHLELFAKVLRRYQGIVKETVQNPVINQNRLGKAEAFVGDARHLPLDDASVDCVITSPPYSFAIDYADNDALQLEFLGYDVKALRNQMLGLWGKRKADKLKNYFDDMKLVVEEIARVLKPGRHAVFIIGSNTNQTGGIRLEQTVIDHFAAAGAPLVRSILKPIKGMHNTMKEEYILFFQKA